jgi:phosphopantothenoylcysteine decarboxylase/phosphopantothenate--cysteine ligase
MNDRMYCNPTLQKNIAGLKATGVRFIDPETGNLACGVTGQGRLAETERIIGELASLFLPQDLAGQSVLVTAGPTREQIDPVRFISNPSTGKMGYALAVAAKERGAKVVLITGPTQLAPPTGVTVVPVVSAGDMHGAVMERVPDSDIIIMAAAVSDFRPLRSAARKIKKEDAPDVVQLERTVDILAELGKAGGKQLLVGFAAETDDGEQNAQKKLRDKNLDMIVMNELLKPGSGFGTDTNAVTILDRAGKRYALPTQPKSEVARSIVNIIADLLKRRTSPSS